MNAEQWFNLAEAFFWVFAAAVILREGRRRRRWKGWSLGVGITLICFGASDVVEIFSGSWWEPFWLLCLKGACLLSLLIHLATFVWRKYHRSDSTGG